MLPETVDYLIELNQSLQALRLVYPNTSRLEAVDTDPLISDLWHELEEIDLVAAHTWIQVPDHDLTREELHTSSGFLGLDGLGRISGDSYES